MEREEVKKKSVIKPVTVKIEEKDQVFATDTINISSSGAYCRMNYPLPLLSKVAITLVVPIQTEDKIMDKKINCVGTIVRTHPVIIEGKTTGYDVAIFFNELKKEDEIMISKYVNQLSNKETDI